MCDDNRSSFADKCMHGVEEYGPMISAEPGTKAVFRRYDPEAHKPIAEWSASVVGWVQMRSYGSDGGLYVNTFVEPLIANFDGFAVPSREYGADLSNVRCVGFVLPDGTTTEDGEQKPGTYLKELP